MSNRIFRRLHRLYQRGVRPLVSEVKFLLCALGVGRYTFAVDDFASVRFECRTRREANLTAYFGYEKMALGAFLFHLKSDDVVWDIGAAFGLYSVHSAKFCESVVAFEPEPVSCERLARNIQINGLQSKITVREIALSTEDGEVELFMDGYCPSLAGDSANSRCVRVQMTTVDNLIAAGNRTPTVMKIDVEGAEAGVLRGAQSLLRGKNKPRLLFVEVHPQFLPSFGESEESVERLVLDAGYRLLAKERRAGEFYIVAISESV
jgi:FkbM family methyltransferase